MESESKKHWYKSKTIWSGIGMIGTGIATIAMHGDVSVAITSIVGGFGIIFSRKSTKQIK